MRSVLFLDIAHLFPLFVNSLVLSGVLSVHLATSGPADLELTPLLLVALAATWLLPMFFIFGATSALAFYQLVQPPGSSLRRALWCLCLIFTLGSLAPLHWFCRGRALLMPSARPPGKSRCTARPKPAPRPSQVTLPYHIPSVGIGAPTIRLRTRKKPGTRCADTRLQSGCGGRI